jgi:hypothetical protein
MSDSSDISDEEQCEKSVVKRTRVYQDLREDEISIEVTEGRLCLRTCTNNTAVEFEIPDIYARYDPHSFHKSVLMQNMNFTKEFKDVSDFQIFFQSFGTFPNRFDNGPNKTVIHIRDYFKIIEFDMISMYIYQKTRHMEYYLSMDIYLALSPVDAPPQHFLDFLRYSDKDMMISILNGFNSLFDLFRTSVTFRCYRSSLQFIPFISSCKAVIDKKRRKSILLVEYNEYHLLGLSKLQSELGIDNLNHYQLDHAIIGEFQNYLGFLNHLPIGCAKHSHYNWKGERLNADAKDSMYMTVFVGSKNAYCARCQISNNSEKDYLAFFQ